MNQESIVRFCEWIDRIDVGGEKKRRLRLSDREQTFRMQSRSNDGSRLRKDIEGVRIAGVGDAFVTSGIRCLDRLRHSRRHARYALKATLLRRDADPRVSLSHDVTMQEGKFGSGIGSAADVQP